MTPDFDRLARHLVDDWETDIIAQPIDLTEAIAAALLAAAAQQREEDARIADNLAKWADAKKPRDDVADAEHVICTRIAAAIRGKP